MQGKKARRSLWVLLILTLCFIWGNSLMPAAVSACFSEWVKELCNAVLGGVGSAGLSGDGVLRKVAHATEFAVLGAEVFLLLRPTRKNQLPALALVGLLSALADETIQLFVEGRAGMVRDLWIDFGGFCAGAGLAALAILFHRHRIHKQAPKSK